MKFIEITTKTTTAGAEMVSAVYDMMGAQGCVINDKSDYLEDNIKGVWDYVDEERIAKMPDYVTVTAYLGENETQIAEKIGEKVKGLTEFADFDLGTLDFEWNVVDDTDWKYEWKKYYKPFDVGEKLYVRPYWEEAKDTSRMEIVLDPGMAFGNGTHETTYMCMELIEKYVERDSFVYDVGCGTGILAVAAVKLGAKHALAIDRDSVAADVAKHNIELNALEGEIQIKTGDLLKGEKNKADMISANIIADVIIGFSEDAYKKLNTGGIFISSGIISERGDETRKAIEDAGFKIVDSRKMGEWCAFAAVKNG
jgi:ribosomal protein L11 methyltransferase